MQKSLFLSENPEGEVNISIRESKTEQENEQAFDLDKFTTKDLLRLKYKIGEEVENRMDVDEVLEDSTDKLVKAISNATSMAVAKTLRFITDRISHIEEDLKRNKKLERIILDEFSYRMSKEGTDEMRFDGIMTVSYKSKTVYSPSEEGWEKVYSTIAADTVKAQVDTAVQKFIAENELLYPRNELAKIAKSAYDYLIDDIKDNPNNLDSFGILQKRFTSTTLKDMESNNGKLPDGVISKEIQDLKARKSK